MKKLTLSFLSILAVSIFMLLLMGNSIAQNESSKFQYRAVAEVGFVSVLSHKIQLGNSGTYFDYVKEGGQDVLFPTLRFSLEMDLNKKNTFIILYQPLRIETQAVLQNSTTFNGLMFPANKGIKAVYNFPFYRFSYLRELAANNEKFKMAIGLTVQIRNATISFESTDGTLFTDNRDIGIVPALKLRTKYNFTPKFYSEIEADGIYAPVSYLNGSDNEIVGAILDASWRFGAEVNPFTNMFLNFRYLGGGAVGSGDPDFPGDGYVKNWLHFFNVSAGFILKL
ncbi:MAG: hypothetical protein H6Q25_442 [Bacteroidetes bacterium]|nr:hypothetical protein [Bacteroidota bacterium]